MPVVLIHQGPTVTAENYRATVQKLAGKDKLESLSDWPVGGILFHSAGDSPSGFRVVDVWESQDACDASVSTWDRSSKRSASRIRRRCTRRRPSFRVSPQLRQERRVVRRASDGYLER